MRSGWKERGSLSLEYLLFVAGAFLVFTFGFLVFLKQFGAYLSGYSDNW